MDTFSACIAFGPLAIYLLTLGAINLARRPLVASGTRESLSLGLALMGLAVVGPMQLFMPQEAATRFGVFVWMLLVGFYVLCLTLAIMLSRPRIVVYNVSRDQLRSVLDETARRLDPDAIWAGKALSMPLARVHLQLQEFSPLSNVSLVATSDDQSVGAWRRLETALRAGLRDAPVASQQRGIWLVVWGLIILSALAVWVAENPHMIARGLDRLLNP